MPAPIKVMILQTRHIESISYLTAELVNAFPAPQYEVTLVYLESGDATATDKLARACYFLGLDKTAYKGLRLKAIKVLRPFLEQHHFDVVIANMYKPVHLLMQLRRSISASVCIGIIHAFGEFDRPMRRWMLRWMLDARWRMVGVSEPVRQYLIGAQCGLDQHNTFAINNAVDVAAISADAIARPAVREQFNLPMNGMVFGTVGRCVKGKRHLELIKAFELFSEKKDNVFLVIIGEGELRPELESYVEQRDIGHKVLLAGHINRAARVMRLLDVFVFPSESEGFGIALLEAMAAGVPAIVHDVEPLKSIVATCGYAVNCAEISALAKVMDDTYLLAPDVLTEKGQAHYLRAYEYYDISQYRVAYRNLVEQLLG